jgi:hypothetical protein
MDFGCWKRLDSFGNSIYVPWGILMLTSSLVGGFSKGDGSHEHIRHIPMVGSWDWNELLAMLGFRQTSMNIYIYIIILLLLLLFFYLFIIIVIIIVIFHYYHYHYYYYVIYIYTYDGYNIWLTMWVYQPRQSDWMWLDVIGLHHLWYEMIYLFCILVNDLDPTRDIFFRYTMTMMLTHNFLPSKNL